MPDRPKVLVTRAEPGAQQTAQRLRRRGYSALVSPAIILGTVTPPPVLPLGSAGGLIFTSANGVRFFAGASGRRDLTAWCVGPATARAAHDAGFGHIQNARGNADDLAILIRHKARRKAGPLIHVANEAAAGELAARLRGDDFEVIFASLYKAMPASKLKPMAAKSLKTCDLHAVLVHSAKGARAFARLAKSFDVSAVRLVAVSEKAAQPALQLGWLSIDIAAAPNETALIAALESAAPVTIGAR